MIKPPSQKMVTIFYGNCLCYILGFPQWFQELILNNLTDFCFIDKTFKSVLELYNILLYLQYDAIKRKLWNSNTFCRKMYIKRLSQKMVSLTTIACVTFLGFLSGSKVLFNAGWSTVRRRGTGTSSVTSVNSSTTSYTAHPPMRPFSVTTWCS